ncbi:MAG TPA: methyltransferase domain-containing protein [Gemmataceae bacterium]|nr:methyltransferase domain-containing protein [Gemmataceae bacterium]
MKKRVERPGVSKGYDLWSESYDQTPNPLVALDRRTTLDFLAPRPGEYILDAACGTGFYLNAIAQAGGRPIGLDFSRCMLRVARCRVPRVPLIYADLESELPFPREDFDAVLCALVGEHLTHLPDFFREVYGSLKPGGRMAFSVFHPELVAAGIEANFEQAGVEYRLGALPYSVHDYLNIIAHSGFRRIRSQEFCGDEELVRQLPVAAKYLNRPLLLVVEAWR